MSLQHLDLDIALEYDPWHEALPDLEELAHLCCVKTLEFTGYTRPTCEISLVFADDGFIQNLNKKYREKDKPTNVLSFPLCDPSELSVHEDFLALGDIILAYETVESEAAEQKKSLRAHSAHLVVHGLLHLLGYDHEDEKEAEKMEALEIRILKSLGIHNPYEDAA